MVEYERKRFVTKTIIWKLTCDVWRLVAEWNISLQGETVCPTISSDPRRLAEVTFQLAQNLWINDFSTNMRRPVIYNFVFPMCAWVFRYLGGNGQEKSIDFSVTTGDWSYYKLYIQRN